MEKFKGTQGEWKYDITGRRQRKITVTLPATDYKAKTELILGYIDSEDDCGNPECCNITEHANAKLIAAAPDLLAAALKIQSEIDYDGLLTESYEQLLNAIKKALG